jgi:hypothetical protein
MKIMLQSATWLNLNENNQQENFRCQVVKLYINVPAYCKITTKLLVKITGISR